MMAMSRIIFSLLFVRQILLIESHSPEGEGCQPPEYLSFAGQERQELPCALHLACTWMHSRSLCDRLSEGGPRRATTEYDSISTPSMQVKMCPTLSLPPFAMTTTKHGDGRRIPSMVPVNYQDLGQSHLVSSLNSVCMECKFSHAIKITTLASTVAILDHPASHPLPLRCDGISCSLVRIRFGFRRPGGTHCPLFSEAWYRHLALPELPLGSSLIFPDSRPAIRNS